MEENLKIPNHVAIILDGNGRWARAKGMPRNYGHVQGAKTVEVICEEAYRMGIQYLTVYAFSTENWKRPCSTAWTPNGALSAGRCSPPAPTGPNTARNVPHA